MPVSEDEARRVYAQSRWGSATPESRRCDPDPYSLEELRSWQRRDWWHTVGCLVLVVLFVVAFVLTVVSVRLTFKF